MTEQTNEISSDMSALLDADFSSIEDLPEYVTPNPGTYDVTVTHKVDKTVVNYIFTINQILELADPEVDPATLPRPGDKFSIRFDLAHEFGAPAHKKFCGCMMEHTGLTRIGDIIQAFEGAHLAVTTTLKAGKKKGDEPVKYFVNIAAAQVLD